MKNYYVNQNAQPNGDHEVHTDECSYFKSMISKKSLGSHSNCKSAVTEAQKTYPQSNGCKSCSNECHTS